MTNSDKDITSNNGSSADPNAAANLIRQKIDKLYKNEPDAIEEAEESFAPHDKPLSKHQRYMREISSSGRSLADIQTAWHAYYAGLSDKEKHEVWQEFYAEHNKNSGPIATPKPPESPKNHSLSQQSDDKKASVHSVSNPRSKKVHSKRPGSRTVADVKQQLLSKADSKAKVRLKAKQHFQSLLFGVGMGMVVVLILLFSFFNDRFIAPFITPSKQVSSTPIIIDSSTTAVDPNPKVIIPKINVEIPVVYDEPSIAEDAIQKALERGVVHYATTPLPGEKGNAVIFGHSSNNILNKGQYKFAFVLLNKLENGDIFYLTKDGVRYGYKIYEKKIVKPTEVGVLNNTDKLATATLITCDPPGTSLNRLVVIGEQISPDPNKNKASSVANTNEQIEVIPSNAPSLWQRITSIFD
ncbi:MAG: Sortase [Patescibacteria group bacterium]|nr:Sortase [Patescibacteria group bacterium]